MQGWVPSLRPGQWKCPHWSKSLAEEWLKHGGHLGYVEVGSMTTGHRQSYPKGPFSLRQEKLRIGRANPLILPKALKSSKIWMEPLPGGETVNFLLQRWEYQGTEICVLLMMALKRDGVGKGRKWTFLCLHSSSLSGIVIIPSVCVEGHEQEHLSCDSCLLQVGLQLCDIFLLLPLLWDCFVWDQWPEWEGAW